MQYRTGTATFTTGSNIVTGQGTLWLNNASAGDGIKKASENSVYTVASVDSDSQLTMQTNYAGSGESNVEYQITRDYTANLGLIEINAGDRDWPFHLTQSLRKIDSYLADLVPNPKETTEIPIADSRVVDGSAPPMSGEVYDASGFRCYLRRFSGTADNNVMINWGVPKWMGPSAQLRYRVHSLVTESTGPADQGVVFIMSAKAINHGYSIAESGFSGEYVSKRTGLTYDQNTKIMTDWSDYFSVNNITSGEAAMFNLVRKHDHVDDTYPQNIGVIEVDVEWTKV